MSLIKHTIKFSDKSKPVIAIHDDDIDDTSTSLTMCSYNSLNSTNILNNSVLHLMEHFCGPTEPRSPTAGQLWVDTSGAPNEPDRLKVYISQSPGVLKFMDVGGTVISKTGSLRHTGQIEAVDNYNKIPQVTGNSSTPSPPSQLTQGFYASLDTGTSLVDENPSQISASSLLGLRLNYSHYGSLNGLVMYPKWHIGGVEQTAYSGNYLFFTNLTPYINQTITLVVDLLSNGNTVTSVNANNSVLIVA